MTNQEANVPFKPELKNALPELIYLALCLLKQYFVKVDTETLLNFLICKLLQMFTCKKIYIDEAGDKVIMNFFSLIFMGSGNGKDRITKIIDTYLLRQFHEWFDIESENLYISQLKEYQEQLKADLNKNNDNTKNISVKEQGGECYGKQPSEKIIF